MDRKKTERSPEEIKALTVRLNKIEGQINGVKKMLDRGDYCIDIMTQVMAISAALRSFNNELLDTHLRRCVVKDIQNGNTEAIDEISVLMQRAMKL